MARPKRTRQTGEAAAVARKAPFALVGTVRKVGASNVSTVPADENTAVVRVDEVVASPTRFGDLAGQEITLRLSRGARRGQKALFLATSHAYGEGVVLDELDRVPPREAQRIGAEVVAEKRDQYDADLIKRLQAADLVVYAKVTAVGPLATGDVPGWLVAELLVWRILKGDPPSPTRVLFPFPRSQKFRDAPQFVEGQEGVWILHAIDRVRRDLGRIAPPKLKGAFAALDELDVHSPAGGRLIRLLLLSVGAGGEAR